MESKTPKNGNGHNNPIDLVALAIGGLPLTGRQRARRARRRAAAAAAARKARRAVARRRRRRQRKRLFSTAGEAPLEARADRRRAAWRPELGGDAGLFPRPLWERIVRVMAPGEWYTVLELGELTGAGRRAVDAGIRAPGGAVRRRGLLERGRFGDGIVRRPRAVGGGRPLEARFVWRLTAAGERARELALLLG